MPPICVLSNARCTRATNAPSVTSASSEPEDHRHRGDEVAPGSVGSGAPIAASANSE